MKRDQVAEGPPVWPLHVASNVVYALPDVAGVLLVDAGPDFEGAWEILTGQLGERGVTPEQVHTVVLTHAHADHAGLAARWQTLGARILVGRDDVPALKLDAEAREAERALARAELRRHGMPAEVLRARSEGERYTRWPAPLRMTPVQVDAALDDGDTVDGHGRTLAVQVCPGHTPGTLLLTERAAGTVYTGDHLLPRMAATVGIQIVDGRRVPSLPRFLASLHTCRPAAGTLGYPGHGEPMADAAEAVDWTVRFLEQRARRVLAQVHQGAGTVYDLALRLFRHLPDERVRPVMAETLGLLDLLAERGLVLAEEGEPVLWRMRNE